MMPYPRGLILENTHNYGIMKTETVFGFGPSSPNNYVNNSFNATEPLGWILNNENFQKRSLQVEATPTATKNEEPKATEPKRNKKVKPKKKLLKKGRRSKRINKCIIKFLKKGQKGGHGGIGGGESIENWGGKKTRRRGSKFHKMHKKYMMPVILGLLAAKSLLIPIALKALAFMSAKGLMLAFFSTVLASVMSLKGMFNHPHEYHNRKDDAKTQVEIIQVPTKSEDHVFYDDHYRRGDLIPVIPNEIMFNRKINMWKGNERSKNRSGERFGNRFGNSLSGNEKVS